MPVVSGHDALIAMEVDPVGAPNVFTTIGELNGDLTFEITRAATETTAHNYDIDTYIGGVLKRGEIPISVNYVYGDSTHAALMSHLLTNQSFKLRHRGPGGLANTDEVIMNGFLTSWSETNPVGDGVRTAEGSFRPSGSMVVDSTSYGV